MLIFEHSKPSRRAQAQAPSADKPAGIPEKLLRKRKPRLPEVSEMQAVRHYTRLSQKNFSIDTQFYPLGSCTMKYNPRACNSLAMLPGLINRHPLAPDTHSQGFMSAMYETAGNPQGSHRHVRSFAGAHGRGSGGVLRHRHDTRLS